MLRRPGTRTCAALLVTGVLVLGAPLAAQADEPASTGSHSQSDRTTSSDQQQIRALTEKIAALQATADARGTASQKADERYLDAKARAATAQAAMRDARTAANAAAGRARDSRARASAIAARLARTDMGTLPLDLMLNQPSAGRVLGGLSSAKQLSAQADVLLKQAKADEAEARRLARASAERATEAAKRSDDAEKAYAQAKRDAADAKRDVEDAKSQQAALIQEVAQQQDSTAGAVCDSLGDASVACAATASAAPTSTKGGTLGDRVVAFARAQIGEPYVFAAAGPDSWDCSGLTLGAWASVGVNIGIHSATAQYRVARDAGELVPVADAKPGDLLWYTDGSGDMYHITIYSGDGKMLEAPYPGSTVREVPVRTGDLLGQAGHITR